MVAIDTSRGAAIASVMLSRAWATIDELLGAVLDRTVTRAELREFVVAQWNAKRFAFRAGAIAAWAPRVVALAERQA